MKTILITGGAGYIGSHTLLQLARKNTYERIVVFDNLSKGNIEAVDIIKEHTDQEIVFVQGDLLNPVDLEETFQTYDPDAVIHFAAFLEAGTSMFRPTEFFENNISGTINLVKAMQAHGTRKIVFSSTAAIYGTPTNLRVTEEFPPQPENWYGYTKLVIENLLRSLATDHTRKEERIDSAILRYFNAAGNNEDLLIGIDQENPTNLIPVAIQTVFGERDKLVVFGNDYDTPDGTCIRDYIHVDDLASGHIKALAYLKDFEGSTIVNLGTSKGSSNLEVIKKLEEIHGKFKWEFGDRRPGDPPAYFADNTKARNLLGWEPKFDLDMIVKTAYAWKKKYPKGYKSL